MVRLPAYLLSCASQLHFKPKVIIIVVRVLCGSYLEIWCKVFYLVDYLFFEPSFSIYKSTLKSKSSINEVNQVAQVCFLISILFILL